MIEKSWNELTKDDLTQMYFKENMIKTQIANLYGVTKSQVSYKLKKYGLNMQSKMIKDSMIESFKDFQAEEIQKLIFSSDNCAREDDDELEYGYVKVTKGKRKGCIGKYDDDEGAYGFVYWGDMVSAIDSCEKIPLSSLSNNITTYDLVSRAQILLEEISKDRINIAQGKKGVNYKKLINLYGEYVIIIGLLNKNYEETFYLRSNCDTQVFLSHSSADKDLALMIATDLELAGISVWLDVWDISCGLSIPKRISDGLDNSQALIMLVSNEYLNSVFCNDEWEAYYMKYNKKRPNAILPIMIEDTQPPTILAARKYLRFRALGNTYDEMLRNIKKAIVAL